MTATAAVPQRTPPRDLARVVHGVLTKAGFGHLTVGVLSALAPHLNDHARPAGTPGPVVVDIQASRDVARFLARNRAAALTDLVLCAATPWLGRTVPNPREPHHPELAAGPPPVLTDRQRDILELVADGRDTATIARELHVSADTVKTHLTRIYKGLGARSQPHAVALAYQCGILGNTHGDHG